MRDCVLMARGIGDGGKILEQTKRVRLAPKQTGIYIQMDKCQAFQCVFCTAGVDCAVGQQPALSHTVLCCHCSVDKTKEHWLSCVLLRKELQPTGPARASATGAPRPPGMIRRAGEALPS